MYVYKHTHNRYMYAHTTNGMFQLFNDIFACVQCVLYIYICIYIYIYIYMHTYMTGIHSHEWLLDRDGDSQQPHTYIHTYIHTYMTGIHSHEWLLGRDGDCQQLHRDTKELLRNTSVP